MMRIPKRLREVAKITVLKLKAGTQWLPTPLWFCMMLGAALAGGVHLVWSRASGEGGEVTLHFRPEGVLRSRRILLCLFRLMACLLGLIVLGYSHTLVYAFFVLLPFSTPRGQLPCPGVVSLYRKPSRTRS